MRLILYIRKARITHDNKNSKIMKKYFLFLLLLIAAFALMASCGGNKKATNNWLAEDDVKVAIDETFAPIMQEEVETFGMMHPEAGMKPVYCSEDSALRLLLADSLRCCVVTRKLLPNELEIIKAHTLGAKQSLIATDAVALIVNKNCPDSLITLDEIKKIVTGKITKWEQLENSSKKGTLNLVFDHSGSSTVRFMKDSLCAGRDITGNVFASDSGTNRSVIEMVQRDPDIIGVVGTNWLKEGVDSVLTSFKNLPVSVMKVSRKSGKEASYVRPFQYYIATADYPLLRSVYVINTDPRTNSLLKLFYYFLKGQKGQTIICNNSQLLPITPVQVKSVRTVD